MVNKSKQGTSSISCFSVRTTIMLITSWDDQGCPSSKAILKTASWEWRGWSGVSIVSNDQLTNHSFTTELDCRGPKEKRVHKTLWT